MRRWKITEFIAVRRRPSLPSTAYLSTLSVPHKAQRSLLYFQQHVKTRPAPEWIARSRSVLDVRPLTYCRREGRGFGSWMRSACSNGQKGETRSTHKMFAYTCSRVTVTWILMPFYVPQVFAALQTLGGGNRFDDVSQLSFMSESRYRRNSQSFASALQRSVTTPTSTCLRAPHRMRRCSSTTCPDLQELSIGRWRPSQMGCLLVLPRPQLHGQGTISHAGIPSGGRSLRRRPLYRSGFAVVHNNETSPLRASREQHQRASGLQGKVFH